MTVAHLRTYTINDGMMDRFLVAYWDRLVPAMSEFGMDVKSAWGNDERSEFIWIRTYGENEADVVAKEKLFYGSGWWEENGAEFRSYTSHLDIKLIRSA